MKAIREDVLHRAFTDMWNKLYTNQGTILEPLLKELTELVAARQDSEETDNWIRKQRYKRCRANPKPSHEERIYGLCSFYGEQ